MSTDDWFRLSRRLSRLKATGFTASRYGMTEEQIATLTVLLTDRLPIVEWFHHGDCVKGDEKGHEIATALGLKTHSHPPISTAWRAFCEATFESPPKGYIPRNHDIVDQTAELIGAPYGPELTRAGSFTRSGTWATVRYARKLRRMITIIHPDGSLEFSP